MYFVNNLYVIVYTLSMVDSNVTLAMASLLWCAGVCVKLTRLECATLERVFLEVPSMGSVCLCITV